MVPDWNLAGVLPALRPGKAGHSVDRSPYLTGLSDVVQRFGTSPKRVAILRGLLAFRAQLHATGITSGFQWLDGSFMEQVEVLENRDPQDIDIVTYFDIPAGESEQGLVDKAPRLFDHDDVKAAYQVDHYSVVMGQSMNADSIREITYWYSMWSHRRNGIWKGFIQVSLDPQEDVVAHSFLPLLSGWHRELRILIDKIRNS